MLAAVLVALGTGLYPYLRLSPTGASVTGALDQSVSLGGVRYRLDSIRTGTTFPAADRSDPPVTAPPHATIVLVGYTQTVVDTSLRLDEHYCDFSLRSPGATWTPDDTLAEISRPADQSCSGTDDHPLAYRQPRRVGVLFLVPTSQLGDLTFRITVNDGETRRILDLRR